MRAIWQFLKEYWLRILSISAALLVPCFWQRRIEAGDLGSHVYNAWLAQLIEQGRAPGLWIARQWNNVLFDLLLLHLGNIFGLHAAERIAVSLAVLIFFWGAFALIWAISSASSENIPWRILPLLAMFTYGATFQFGFFNYYISLGLAFAALAVLYRGRGWERGVAVLLMPLIWMAHPLGLVLLVAVGAYLLLARVIPVGAQIYCFAAAALALLGLRRYLVTHYDVFISGSKFMFNGTDQIFTYGRRYGVLAYALLLFIAVCISFDIISRYRGRLPLASYRLTLQLYGLVLVATFLLPSAIYVPSMSAAHAGYLTERITSVSAVLLCCLMVVAKPKKWHFAGLLAFAAIYFVFLYQDTAIINKMEGQVESFERILPPGQRVVATIWPLNGSRIYMDHMVDRACVGQCFSYGNYEPASQQFRIRAQDGNHLVVSNNADSGAIQAGIYAIQPQDLPLYQIYQCDLDRVQLCMRELTAGETNGRIGFHAPQ